MALFEHSVFGWVALAAAILNLIRPHLLPALRIALAAAAFGVVLYNAVLSGACRGSADPQLRAARAHRKRRRIAPSAKINAQSQSDCQFAKLSLKTI